MKNGEQFADYIRIRLSELQLAAAEFGVDVGIGIIPIIGDIADYAEFNVALATGKDRWGNEVANWELVLMGVSAIPVFGDLFKVVRRLAA